MMKNNKKKPLCCVGHYMLILSKMSIGYCSQQWGPEHWANYDKYDKVLWDSTWNIFYGIFTFYLAAKNQYFILM